MSDLQPLPHLQTLPDFAPRTQPVPAPELGGQVTVRGLMASETFALSALRSQAMRRVREAAQAHRQRVALLHVEFEERVAALPPNVAPPPWEPPAFVQPELDFSELKAYGRYGSELLAHAVVNPAGLALATAQQWEVIAQHHPALISRLLEVAEQLSGLSEEDVQKNSPSRN